MATIRMRYDGLEATLKTELDNDLNANVIEFNESLTHAGGIQVPTLLPEQYIPLSILDADFRLQEIVWLVEYDSGAPARGKVLRAQELTQLRTHVAGRKVVQAATVLDFTLVQDHNNDPNAHPDLVAMLKAYADAAVAAHNVDPNAHTYLARTASPTFTGVATFEDIALTSDLIVNAGAIITINPGGQVIINGTFTLNGKQLFISNTEPVSPPANLVWIKTFG